MSKSDVSNALDLIRKEQATPASVARAELAGAIDALVGITAETYSRESGAYAQARTAQPWKEDARMAES
jgi:hypothetical protein